MSIKLKMMTMKNDQLCIETFDSAFLGMIERNEDFVIVKNHPIAEIITLPLLGKVNAEYCRVDLVIEDKKNGIRLFYTDTKSHTFAFSTEEEKHIAIEYLHTNKILPTVEEILQARSLMNTPGAYSFFGCGCD